MKSGKMLQLAMVILGGLMIASNAEAVDRSAAEILADIEYAAPPSFDQDRSEDEQYTRRYAEIKDASKRTAAVLIFELYKTHPDHKALIELMPRRWKSMQQDAQQVEAVAAELASVIETDPDNPLATEARYRQAITSMRKNLWIRTPNHDQAERVFDAFIKGAPTDARGVILLNALGDSLAAGSDRQIALYLRIKNDYPDDPGSVFMDGKIRQAIGIGEPFELEFTDAITRTKIRMKDLHGQVVVLDFWATWCVPCVAEMPHMKELYAEYRDQGVQFIGISLDFSEKHGGLEALKKFVKENDIPWLHYYQGNGSKSEFSTSWGIGGIPALFIIDKQGRLRSAAARGRLGKLIPELLAE